MTDADGEIRELSAADMREFRPASEVLRPELLAGLATLKRTRGAQIAPTKIATTIRFDADVITAFKAGGNGWQTRINAALKDWLKTHSPA
jgi:uncharacterized protein (DUF4415 family)